MPPKKKSTAAAKISKQDSVKETLPEPEISPSKPNKIPKKPFFRFMDSYTLTKVPYIRVKLWKICSCSLSDKADSFYTSEKNKKEEFKRKKKFRDAFKSSTVKKSLKHAKRIIYDPSQFTKLRFMRQLCSTWRLESLLVSVPQEFENYNVLRPFLKPTLKSCHLSWDFQESKIDPKLIVIFRILKKCKLIISSYMDSFNVWINPEKLLSSRNLKLQTKDDDHFISEKIIINTPECFEEIRFANFDPYMRDRTINLDLPSSMPNLKEFQIALQAESPGLEAPLEDLSFVKQYSKLQSLKMGLIKYEPKDLDFLADLPDLKSLSIFSRLYNYHGYDKCPIKILPNLTNLETFKLILIVSRIFTAESIKDFIYQNKNLKNLDLSLSIQDLGVIFEENEDFVLPDIEKLRLSFVHLERPYAGGAKKIAEILKNHGSIKELILEISHSYADLIAILLKDGVAKMKSLERLILRFARPGGLEENKFKHLKDVLSNNIGLETLELDLLSDVIGTRELGTIIDSLMKLKNLKKFIFKARFAKMTPAAFNKLSNFIVSLRNLKVLELDFKGISEEDGEELKQKLLPKFPLSKDSFSFVTYPMDTSNSLLDNQQTYKDAFLCN